MSDQHPFRQVVVAIPAHDEQRLIGRALDAVLVAAEHLQRRRSVQVAVGVSAHRCSDATYSVAAAKLSDASEVRGLVIRDEDSGTVGEVRHRLIRELVADSNPPASPGSDERGSVVGAASRPSVAGSDAVGVPVARGEVGRSGPFGGVGGCAWVFSTDADSVVPQRWLTDMLRIAEAARADAVAGLTELIDWSPTQRARRAYSTLIRSGMSTDGGHGHEYAANLAVRLDTYLAVGGFPAVTHGEERALLAKIRRAGGVVATPREPVVQTSGRIPGRAHHGLSDLLASL